MTTLTIKAKANAHYQCQRCGSTEYIQAHHQIRGDDSSLLVLCAECHSEEHPDVPKALFFTTPHQPYWHNISASTIAKECGVCSRTIIRRARVLQIPRGYLNDSLLMQLQDAMKVKLIKLKLKYKGRGCEQGAIMLKLTEAAKELAVSYWTIRRWIKEGKLRGIRLPSGSYRVEEKDIESIKKGGK